MTSTTIATDMLAVPPKKPTEVDVVKPLRNLLQSAYSSGATAKPAADTATTPPPPTIDFAAIAEEFGKLRSTAIWKFYDKYETSLDVVYG